MKTFTTTLAVTIAMITTSAYANDVNMLVGQTYNAQNIPTQLKNKNFAVRVDKDGKVLNAYDAGNVGDGKSVTTVSTDANATDQVFDNLVTYTGQDAIDRLGNDLNTVAADIKVTPERLKATLLQDDTLKVDANGNLVYVEHDINDMEAAAGATAPLPPSSVAFSGDAYKLHSNPGASKVIYLDFNGHNAVNTWWNGGRAVNALAWQNGSASTIYQIWSAVAEDYLPFDVDVTTEEPTMDQLLKTSATDTTYGMRAVITSSPSTGLCSNCGGVAYVATYGKVSVDDRMQPVWIFAAALGNSVKYIAEATSHEVGHSFGLHHDGTSSTSYYAGHGGWAPIMGVGYYKQLVQWNSGTYPGANNKEDDLLTITNTGVPYRNDDVGSTIATAVSFNENESVDGVTTIKPSYGIIERSTDVDMYRFTTAGKVDLKVEPSILNKATSATYSPIGNLDTKLTVYDETGKVVATDTADSTTSAEIHTTLTPGAYYAAVTATGKAAVTGDAGYTVTNSLGQYNITGSYATKVVAVPPVAAITATTTQGEAPLGVGYSANNSVAGSGSLTYKWDLGYGNKSTSSNPTFTYMITGLVNTTLTVTNSAGLTSTAIVPVNVSSPTSGPAFYVKDVTVKYIVSGSKVYGNALVTIVDRNGKPISNAAVYGRFTGSLTKLAGVTYDTEQYKLATTSTNVSMISQPYALSSGTIGFEVTKVVPNDPRYVYDRLANIESSDALTR